MRTKNGKWLFLFGQKEQNKLCDHNGGRRHI